MSMSATTSERPVVRKAREREVREPDFVVRAKTGPGRKDWTTLGYAWARENGGGFSVKLNALPIGTEWGGVLKLLPPFAAEDDIPDEGHV
jgi:hypothetical protein